MRPADAAEMQVFENNVVGAKEILAGWGASAPRRVGIVLDKLGRLSDRLTAAERAGFFGWLKCQRPRERQLFAWSLGAGI